MLPAVIDPPNFDTWWIDGSRTPEGHDLVHNYRPSTFQARTNVTGGSGGAIVYALTAMLNHHRNYKYIGLVENDVLLGSNWFEPTMALFDKGADDGLVVGAVSARCFDDRMLLQRDGYAVMHNLGAGHLILTREAAEIVLRTFRAAYTTDNRRIFSKLSGIDIGNYWAFRDAAHWLTADWHWDAVLAANGLASLALTPSPCMMIGQVPPLAEQGLHLNDKPLDGFIRDDVFDTYKNRLALVRGGVRRVGVDTVFAHETGTWTIFAHQFPLLGAVYRGDWRFRETREFGLFVYHSGEAGCSLELPLFGAANLIVSGTGSMTLDDPSTGYHYDLDLMGEEGKLSSVPIPGGYNERIVTLVVKNQVVKLHGMQVREPQDIATTKGFDYAMLPKPL
jgi:hypothetical protein